MAERELRSLPFLPRVVIPLGRPCSQDLISAELPPKARFTCVIFKSGLHIILWGVGWGG